MHRDRHLSQTSVRDEISLGSIKNINHKKVYSSRSLISRVHAFSYACYHILTKMFIIYFCYLDDNGISVINEDN